MATLLFISCFVLSVFPLALADSTSTGASPSNPIEIVSITKATNTSANTSANTFTVRFIELVSDVTTSSHIDGSITEISKSRVEDTDQAYEVTIVANDPIFVVSSKSQGSLLAFELDNSDSATSTQLSISLPELEVSPEGDITYERYVLGHVTFTATLTGINDGVAAGYQPYIDIVIESVNLDNYRYQPYYHHWRTESSRVTSEGYEKTFSLMTSMDPISGYLMVRTDVEQQGGLVKAIHLGKVKVVRPVDQPEAFPTGFMDFYRGPVNWLTQRDCFDTDTSCERFCVVIGLHISELKVYEHTSDGLVEVPATIRHSNEGVYSEDYEHAAVWSVDIPERGQAPLRRQYTCRATHGQTERVAIMDVDVQINVGLEIDEQASTATVEGDQARPSTKHLTLNCAFYAPPSAVVSFEVHVTGGEFSYYDLAPDSVARPAVNSGVATKVVTFNTSGSSGFPAIDDFGVVTSALCRVRHLYYTDVYYYDLPAIN